ncbi:hypothetical protein [Sphingomonas dokdonensis]|uniref:Uncharacterized protein n=1 Tax=Sphingomonas dokdonensis TaxID=344880 RepID=A0A245ZUT5_9SPHN|nr:hypothetical protein [Sphingomonas dokdonensis]OWK33497.1 hypothetical protein SPDO_03760 [Sphingomonas dokdonensis]
MVYLSVLVAMMGHEHHHPKRTTGGYYVPRPRATDAIGKTLREAFREGETVPGEMHRLLSRLN